MSNRLRGFSLIAVVAAFAAGMLASVQSLPTSGQTATAADIAQGQYIVQNVARCIGCHGATLGGVSNPSNPEFVPRPKIAGLPMFSNDADAVKFFETGLLPDGSKPKPQQYVNEQQAQPDRSDVADHDKHGGVEPPHDPVAILIVDGFEGPRPPTPC